MPLAGLAHRTQLALKTVKAIGVRRTALRIRHEVAQRSGWLARRYPPGRLADWVPPARLLGQLRKNADRGLLFDSGSEQLETHYRRLFPGIGPALFGEADRLAGGQMQYFSHDWAEFDPQRDWFRNPFTGQVVGDSVHWTRVSWDAPASGDLKFQLEPARFAWVFKLARAYAYSGDEKYAAAFWRLFDGWCEQNPPQAGPLWICGQESSLRLLAMAFGLYYFARSSETTDDRFGRLAAMIAAHADRIKGTTVYARSQQNNHALSEGAGLLTAGFVLAGSPAADRWKRAGRAILEEQAPLQIYADGAYTQHSHNYHRVMLNVMSWAVRICERRGERLSEMIYQRLGAAAEFLRQMIDPATGQAPNYGPNDGALVLPLSVCPYEDYRPAAYAAGYVAGRKMIEGAGDWNEELFWLCGPEAAEQAQSRVASPGSEGKSSAAFPNGGYDVLGGRESWCMLRAADYRDRPNQADQLHFDLWWRGINVACDAGAYLYNGPQPWQNALARTAVHNTVTVDDQDQMTRGGRFLWLDWARATRETMRSPLGELALWRGAHDGYRRIEPQLVHRREVLQLGDAHWLVLDRLVSQAPHRFRLHWLLPHLPYQWDAADRQLRLETPQGPYFVRIGRDRRGLAGDQEMASLAAGDPDSTRGWRSRFYGHREPAISLALEIQAAEAFFVTLFGPDESTVEVGENALRIAADSWSAQVTVADQGDALVQGVDWSGTRREIWLVKSGA